MNKMAMTLRNESIEIIVPNSEAYKGAQIKGIKDSTVGGYSRWFRKKTRYFKFF